MFKWNKKIRKIADIAVVGAVGAVLLTIGGVQMFGSLAKYNEYSEAYDAAEKARIDAMRDETGHIPSALAGVDPTETSVGYTSGTICSECGEIYKGHEEIPMLTEQNYDRTVKTSDAGMVVTWSIKQAYIDAHLPSHAATEFIYSQIENRGFITMNGTKYLSKEFNDVYLGIQMSYDKETSLITWNVLEPDYVLNNTVVTLPTVGDHLKITGYPLTIETPGTQDGFVLKASSNNLIVDNDLTVCVKQNKTIEKNYRGVTAHDITINEGKSLVVKNYYYGIYSEGEITVNGMLNTSGSAYKYAGSNTDSAIYAGSNLGSKTINVGANKAVYVEEQLVNVTDNKLQFQDSGKHLIICDSATDIEDMLDYVITGFPVVPTETSEGTAQFGCESCGAASNKTMPLPALTAENYDIAPSVESIDGNVYDVTKYELKDKTNGDIEFYGNKVKLNTYIKAGDYYLSKSLWNTRYPNASYIEDNSTKTLTITLNGTTDINMGDYMDADATVGNGFDFKTYSKVIINGSGTLNLNFTKKSPAFTATSLEIGENAIVNLNGVDRGTTSNQTIYFGVNVSKELKVAGKLNIVKFSSGIYVARNISAGVDVDITSTGEITMKNMSNCTYNYSELRINNAGKFDVSADTSACNGLKAESKLVLTCTGSSITNVTNGYTVYVSSTSTEVDFFIQDSSTFNVTANQYAIWYYTKFVVGNGEDGSGKCNANVTVSTSNNVPLYCRPAKDKESLTVFNSNGLVTIKKTGSTGTTGIYIDGNRNHTFKALSNVDIVNCKSIVTFKNTPQFEAGHFIAEDSSGNPVFKVDSKFVSDYNSSPVPNNVPASINKRA